MTRVLIADDHPFIREGVRAILHSSRELELAGEAANAKDLLRELDTASYDVLLLDISLRDSDGVDVLKEVHRAYPELPIIVFTMYEEDHYAVRAFRAGASGYVTKDSSPEKLVDAIRVVMRGRRYVSAGVAELLAVQVSEGPERAPHERLSDREFQVLRMIAAGKATGEIAIDLGLSAKTVSTYRSRILEKLEMKSTAELTAYAVRHHLLR